MRKVVLYIAMSLDGFIADAEGKVSWIKGDDENQINPEHYDEFISKIDTVIIGYKTYKQIVEELSPTDWVYKNLQSYVLTHKNIEDKENIKYTNAEIKDLVTQIKKEEGKDIWICGGSIVANKAIKENLIDRYHITIIPTVLGEGLRLFEDNNPKESLKLTKSKIYNGIVDLVYEKIN